MRNQRGFLYDDLASLGCYSSYSCSCSRTLTISLSLSVSFHVPHAPKPIGQHSTQQPLSILVSASQQLVVNLRYAFLYTNMLSCSQQQRNNIVRLECSQLENSISAALLRRLQTQQRPSLTAVCLRISLVSS